MAKGGVRLHHPTLFDCMYVIELGTPFANGLPKMCPTCLKAHAKKSLHLKLDVDGNCFVTPGVWETIRREAFGAGLEPLNHVEKPPPLSIGAVAQDKIYVIDQPINRSLTAAPMYVPEKTKYESSDTVLNGFKRLFKHVIPPKEN